MACRRSPCRTAFGAVLCSALLAAHAEFVADLPGGGQVALSTRGASAFRVRILPSVDANCKNVPFETPMIYPEEPDAVYSRSDDESGSGILAEGVGAVRLSSKGELALLDAGGALITTTAPLKAPSSCEVPLAHPPSSKPTLSVSFGTRGGKLYGRGASALDAKQLEANRAVQPGVYNLATYTPYYYSLDGYAAFGVVNKTVQAKLPLSYGQSDGYVVWEYSGSFLELYLMPAATLELASRSYFALVGRPRVPPRYVFGFMASRWGWTHKEYIEDVLSRFRSGGFPIDAFICDFGWFTNQSDYDLTPKGQPWYDDFGFAKKTFPRPIEQLTEYHHIFNVRFGGIRKPRLGNSTLLEMARSKGWLLPVGEPGGLAYPPAEHADYAVDRCLDFSKPEVRTWYATMSLPLLQKGVDFWWNDEGETDYYTFHWWNEAELESLRMKSATDRFFSLNRAFSPGMARLGATVWTGDVEATWEALASMPATVMNWALAGMPYVASDIGGFRGASTPYLMTRWIQAGVFMPIMRVHSHIAQKAHFPWLWGSEAALAIKKALELRYRLIPYHYSLAHRMYKYGSLWMRPLAMDYPHDERAAAVTSQFMDGSLLVAPVLSASSDLEVYLPAGLWYSLGRGGGAFRGPVTHRATFELSHMPAYARAGTILTLAPVVQHTQELPAGPLRVEVYSGADGEFELVEDDGESTAYESGKTRATRFVWNDHARVLRWTVEGSAEALGSATFKHMVIVLIHDKGEQRAEVQELGRSGSIDFKKETAWSALGMDLFKVVVL